MNRDVLLACLAIAAICTASGPANAQNAASVSTDAPLAANIERGGYVRLEVTLTTTATDKVMIFNSACPKQSLWGIDLKELLSGSNNVTMGVSITSPGMGALEFTPLSIDRKSSGFLGSNKTCDVMIDQMRYLSPAFYVRSYEQQQFTVAPTYKQTTSANPGLSATIDTALSIALKLAAVPAEIAAPYQGQVKNVLGQMSVSNNERFSKHPIIRPGPVPADAEFQWRTNGLFTAKDKSTPLDVILTARLIPVATLIPDPPAASGGSPVWDVSDVLSSPFAANLSPGVNPGGTLGSYISSTAATDIANFRKAATKSEASNSCDPILARVQAMGLSDRDEGLLMWAITHDRPPAAVDSFDIDNLSCLRDAWRFAPTEVVATRDTTEPAPPTPKPVVTPGVPATVKQMKAATQIDDSFAIFFKTTVWKERRKIAAGLFRYPVQYTDAGGLIFDSSSALDNVDQWLALHTDATPVVERIGCYTYVAAADPAGKSVMYAVADMMPGKSATQALLTITFANVPSTEDAKIEAIDVTPSISADQKAKIQTANGAKCSASGYKPELVFGS
ncbi:hypothetical protein ACLBKT_09395 [Erythrobacter sp. W302b]|uniref:hypothetical protein n=1 Tax=Erythrobacter sp. W302b TaxID=3389874 RepID=UPI00396AF75A